MLRALLVKAKKNWLMSEIRAAVSGFIHAYFFCSMSARSQRGFVTTDCSTSCFNRALLKG